MTSKTECRKGSDTGVYAPLPNQVNENGQQLGLVKTRDKPGFFANFLASKLPPGRLKQEEEIDPHAVVLLENSRKHKKQKSNKSSYDLSHKKRKTLTVRERKKMKLFKLEKDQQKYAMFEPMHEMWKEYMREIMMDYKKVTPDNPAFQEKLLKADYHGALMTVKKSKCPSYVGVTGILLQETKNTMRLITKENVLKTIPKSSTIFCFELEGFEVTIYGNNFKVKSSERSHRKFKPRTTIDL